MYIFEFSHALIASGPKKLINCSCIFFTGPLHTFHCDFLYILVHVYETVENLWGTGEFNNSFTKFVKLMALCSLFKFTNVLLSSNAVRIVYTVSRSYIIHML